MAFTDVPPLRWRVVVYEPDGVARGQLPVPLDWAVALPFNDLSSMQLSYLNTAPGAALLDAPCEVALEVSGTDGVYTEHPGCRYLNIRQSQDLVQADVTTKLTMPSYGWMLRKIRNINSATFNDEGERFFEDVNIGGIFAALINESKARGNVPFLAIDFDATNDSAGVPWNNPQTMSVSAGQDVHSLLMAMSTQGLCDWRMNGRTLQLYRPDTVLNRDLTTNPTAVVLHRMRDVIAAPDDRSYEEIAHTMFVQGDEGIYVTVEQDNNPSPWGEWEAFQLQSGMTVPALMEALAARALQMADAPRTQMTRELVFRDGSPLPLIDYRTGDNIYGQDENSTYESLRVRQITLNMNNEGIKGNVILGDKFTERDIRMQRQINALAFNSSNFGGGTGGTPTPPPIVDSRVPEQVTGVVANSVTTSDPFGEPVGLIAVSWAPVDESTDGRDQDMSRYVVRYAPFGTENYRYQFVGGDVTSTVVGAGLTIDTTFTVSVQAVGTNNISGVYSTGVDVFVATDEEAPPVPSDPTLSTRLGTIRVHWDGRDEDNLNMPPDFRRIEVEMASGGTGPFSYVGIIQNSAGDLIIADQPYNTNRWFRFRAVDASGNVSDYSGTAFIATQALVDTDIIGEVIDGANIVDGSLVASDKIVANSITAAEIAALTITAGEIAANAITADKIEAGAVTAEKVQAYSIDATRLAIGGSRNLITDSDATDTTLGAIRIANATGNPNSGVGAVWSHESNEFYRVKLNAPGAAVTARLGWFTSSLIDPNLTTGTGTINPLYAYPVDRTMGGLHGKFAYNVNLTSGGWPAGASVLLTLYVRWIYKDGTMATLDILAQPSTIASVTGGWVTYNGSTPIDIPANAVACIPYLRVQFTNGTTAIQVDHTSVYLGQVTGGVLIENGAISAVKIQANAVTTTQLDADAIRAKHTIIGSEYLTATSGQRVYIGPNANYMGQAGIRLFSGQAGERDTNIFCAGVNTGGWELGSFGIVGPEATRNSSGRSDMNFKVGGGFYLAKTWVNNNNRLAGIESPTGSNELLLSGSLPRGTAIGDLNGVFRALISSFQNGTFTWGANNGWRYQGVACPNTSNTTPRYTSFSAASATGFTWQTSASIDEVTFLMYRGGYI